MHTMQVEVVSNEQHIFTGEASFVIVPTVNGELGIYPRHEPVMSLVRPGALRVVPADGGEEVLVAVAGGVLETSPHKITVLADVAVRSVEMDQERAETAKKQAEQRLAELAELADSGDAASAAKAQAALAAAIAELKTLEYLRNRYK